MTVGSLFAGIGGFDLGFQRAGFNITWQVEIDLFCQKVLAKHFPEAKRYGDIRTVGATTLDPVDVICGGFPCQDISVANQEASGLDGKRSGLFFEIPRIINSLRPKYVVLENVDALLRRGIDRVLGALAEIGYDAEWTIIPASCFGLPQPRKRVWIVAYPSGFRISGLFESIDSSTPRQGGPGSTANLFDIARSPFSGTSGFPQPLLRGVDDRPANWVDRIKSSGNAVVPQIPEWIANQILKYESINRTD